MGGIFLQELDLDDDEKEVFDKMVCSGPATRLRSTV